MTFRMTRVIGHTIESMSVLILIASIMGSASFAGDCAPAASEQGSACMNQYAAFIAKYMTAGPKETKDEKKLEGLNSIPESQAATLMADYKKALLAQIQKDDSDPKKASKEKKLKKEEKKLEKIAADPASQAAALKTELANEEGKTQKSEKAIADYLKQIQQGQSLLQEALTCKAGAATTSALQESGLKSLSPDQLMALLNRAQSAGQFCDSKKHPATLDEIVAKMSAISTASAAPGAQASDSVAGEQPKAPEAVASSDFKPGKIYKAGLLSAEKAETKANKAKN